jgi:hypothetical protein
MGRTPTWVLCSRNVHPETGLVRRSQVDHHGSLPRGGTSARWVGSCRGMRRVRCAQSRTTVATPLMNGREGNTVVGRAHDESPPGRPYHTKWDERKRHCDQTEQGAGIRSCQGLDDCRSRVRVLPSYISRRVTGTGSSSLFSFSGVHGSTNERDKIDPRTR